MTHVAVAIVGFRNADDIQRCMVALGDSTYSDFEVVICENGGARSYASLAKAIPSHLPNGQPVRLIKSANNGGFAAGVNICLAASPSADAWWLLNPDTEPSAGAMSALVERLEEGADAVGGPLIHPSGTRQCNGGIWRAWLARAVSIGVGAPRDGATDANLIERTQNYLNGASMMVSRRFLQVTGPMREEYFLYCEEIEWCLRAQRLGMRLGFAPTAFVLHRQGTTTGNVGDAKSRSRLAVYLDERNKMLLTRDCFIVCLPVAALSALALIGLRYLRRGAARQFGYGVSGWVAGLMGRRGPPAWLATTDGPVQ